MRIVIETIPYQAMRYDTVGDYFVDWDGTLYIQVADLGNPDMERLIAIHELIEVTLTEKRGIPEPVIKQFDLDHPELDDPGHDPDAPYHREHVFAEIIERQVALAMGVNWEAYGDAVLGAADRHEL